MKTILSFVLLVPATAALAGGQFVGTRQSGYSADSNARNPFEPIGYRKIIETPAADRPVVIPVDVVRVTSIFPGGAIINEKYYNQGEWITLNVDNVVVKVRLQRVKDAIVELYHPKADPQIFEVPMR